MIYRLSSRENAKDSWYALHALRFSDPRLRKLRSSSTAATVINASHGGLDSMLLITNLWRNATVSTVRYIVFEKASHSNWTNVSLPYKQRMLGSSETMWVSLWLHCTLIRCLFGNWLLTCSALNKLLSLDIAFLKLTFLKLFKALSNRLDETTFNFSPLPANSGWLLSFWRQWIAVAKNATLLKHQTHDQVANFCKLSQKLVQVAKLSTSCPSQIHSGHQCVIKCYLLRLRPQQALISKSSQVFCGCVHHSRWKFRRAHLTQFQLGMTRPIIVLSAKNQEQNCFHI